MNPKPISAEPLSPIPAEISYASVEAFCRVLGHEPENVREIRLRAPRTAEVLVYARRDDGAKYLQEDGVALVAYSYLIESTGTVIGYQQFTASDTEAEAK